MNNLKMLDLLITHGADPNVQDKYDKTAIFYCVENNFRKGVEYLLTHKSDCNITDKVSESE